MINGKELIELSELKQMWSDILLSKDEQKMFNTIFSGSNAKLTQKQKHVVRKEKEKKQNVQTPKLKYSSSTPQHTLLTYTTVYIHTKKIQTRLYYLFI